jgi:D-amino-acid oxidase
MTRELSKAGYEIGRRGFLRSALIASGVAIGKHPLRLRALAVEPTHFPAQSETRHFAPVKVARNRIIREVVGLRPFRSEGFVVEAERLGQKLLVHNYGHGGAGVTLSWGTASQAADIARDFIQTKTRPDIRRVHKLRQPALHFAVLGCGVSGLSTARLLQRHFQDAATTITIYAKNLPPETTSNVAGALWSPTSVYDPQQITAKFADQFRLACRISNRAFQELVGPEYGVRWVDTFELLRNEASLERELTGGNELYPQIQIHRDPKTHFGFPLTRQFSTMVIEPHTYLRALLRDFFTAGGKVIVKEFHSREEIARLREQIIFNCTGLGSRALLNDERLIPVRGQLEVLLPQPEVDYCYLAGGAYMFPRRDGIILGGTWDHEDWSLAPKAEQTTEILEAHAEIMKALK